MSLTRFDFASLPVTPWRNGGGETREIASWPLGAQDFDWRASIATIAQDGPFSAFSGIDRSITLLEGDGVRLFSAGQIDHHLSQVGEPFSFSGDVALQATLLGGQQSGFQYHDPAWALGGQSAARNGGDPAAGATCGRFVRVAGALGCGGRRQPGSR
ncbi:Various environmental stresses-induced protein [Serratia proteamaculans]|nr:Various environmental stresses-induced protein [Serratia proteamaculans]